MDLVFFTAVTAALLFALNFYLYRKARRLVLRWKSGGTAARWVRVLRAAFVLINSPFALLLALWISGHRLHQLPQPVLWFYFYPFYAWIGMLVMFLFVGFPADLVGGVMTAFRWLVKRTEPLPAQVIARRNFLATAAAVVPPALFAISARAVYGSDDLEISPVVDIPVKDLPAAFNGLTITQLSDLHAGAYVRERELARVVDIANGLRSELVVITGDVLDGSLDMLPPAVSQLSRLRAPMGVFGVLGNHDYYADRRGPAYPGCLRIIEGLSRAGVRMLRNSRYALQSGQDELQLVGLDWTGRARGNPNLYMAEPTRAGLRTALAGAESGVPRILLAHHPHVFYEAAEFDIALTLSGHTHGGGQIVILEHNGHPLALGSAMFRYISGLYRDGKHALYVNRGIGVVGIPIRLKCPPEISRFQLVRA